MAAFSPPKDWLPRLERSLDRLLPVLTGAERPMTLRRFAQWLELTALWNQVLDLTAARDADELVDLLVADAAAIVAARPIAAGETWVDVGSGLGAPGIAIALLAPQARVTLVEPKTKRVAFLRSVLGQLGRTDIEVRRCRSEQLPEGEVDVAISRATLPPAHWLEEGARLARERIWVLTAQCEILQRDGVSLSLAVDYQWPLTGAVRNAACYVPGAKKPL